MTCIFLIQSQIINKNNIEYPEKIFTIQLQFSQGMFYLKNVPDIVDVMTFSSQSRSWKWFEGINTLRLRQNGRHFPDDSFEWIFLNEDVWISIEVSMKFVPKGPVNNISALVQIMAWRRPGDKPLSEPMMVSLLTHICVTRPQWVNT